MPRRRKLQSRSPSRRKRTNVAITRRQLFSGIAKAGVPTAIAVTVGTDVLSAGEKIHIPNAAVGLLYDATICIGCKACVAACDADRRVVQQPNRSVRYVYFFAGAQH